MSASTIENYTGGIGIDTAPAPGIHDITAFGAQDGGADTGTRGTGGLGAEIGGDFLLSAGQTHPIADSGSGAGTAIATLSQLRPRRPAQPSLVADVAMRRASPYPEDPPAGANGAAKSALTNNPKTIGTPFFPGCWLHPDFGEASRRAQASFRDMNAPCDVCFPAAVTARRRAATGEKATMQPQPMVSVAPFVADATTHIDLAPPRAVLLSWLSIRRLGPDDRTALAEHLIGLPQQDRRTRFCGIISDAAIRRHCADLDLDDTVCFAALDASGTVVGAALGVTQGKDHACQFVEIAISVAPEYRRRGLGTDLITRVCDAVSACGAESALFEFDPSNAAIRGLVRRLGGLVTVFAHSCTIPLAIVRQSAGVAGAEMVFSYQPAACFGVF